MAEALGWGDLDLSHCAVKSVDYRDYRIEVYESLRKTGDETRYFYMPSVLLLPKTAEYHRNVLRSEHEDEHSIRFKIEMWNGDIQKAVRNELNVQDSQVCVIPFAELILQCKFSGYRTSPEWIKYQSQKVVTFNITCATKENANILLDVFRNSPEDLENKLEVKFALTTRQSKRNETTISIDSVMKGELFSILNQQYPKSSPENMPLLTAEDKQKLLAESYSNIVIESYSETNEAGDPARQQRIYNILEKLMEMRRDTISRDSDWKWQSVFWKDENCRPDRVAKTLNEMSNKYGQETKRELARAVEGANDASCNLAVDLKISNVIKIGQGECKGSFNSSSKSNDDSKSVDILTKDDLSRVEFDGEKFVPKSMDLFRVNLNNIRNKQSYRDSSVNVTDHSAGIRTLRVNICDDIEANMTDSDRERFSRLETALGGINKRVVPYHVHFSVARTSILNKFYCVIPYEHVFGNLGNAMDIASGVFTAPKAGIYFFTFNFTSNGDWGRASIRCNGEEIVGSKSISVPDQGEVGCGASATTIIQLQTGDKVDTYNRSVKLYSDCHRSVNFSGFLLSDM